MEKIGKPSPTQFSKICGRDFPPAEVGFHLCLIGQLVRSCIGDDYVVDTHKIGSLCQDLASLDWVKSLSKNERYTNALSRENRSGTAWNRANWCSPEMKYAMAKAEPEEEVDNEESGEETLGGDDDDAGKAIPHPREDAAEEEADEEEACEEEVDGDADDAGEPIPKPGEEAVSVAAALELPTGAGEAIPHPGEEVAEEGVEAEACEEEADGGGDAAGEAIPNPGEAVVSVAVALALPTHRAEEPCAKKQRTAPTFADATVSARSSDDHDDKSAGDQVVDMMCEDDTEDVSGSDDDSCNDDKIDGEMSRDLELSIWHTRRNSVLTQEIIDPRAIYLHNVGINPVPYAGNAVVLLQD